MSKPEYFLNPDQNDDVECVEDCRACKNYYYCREMLRTRFDLEYPEAERFIKKTGTFFMPLPHAGCDTADVIGSLSPYDHIQIRNNLTSTDSDCPKCVTKATRPLFHSLCYGSDSPNTIVLLPVDGPVDELDE